MQHPGLSLGLSRGVYIAPYRSTADEMILLAIDHRGRRICERTVALGADESAAWLGAEAFLEREDPQQRPLLRLERAG